MSERRSLTLTASYKSHLTFYHGHCLLFLRPAPHFLSLTGLPSSSNSCPSLFLADPPTVPQPESAPPHTFPSEASPHPAVSAPTFPQRGLPCPHFTQFGSHRPHCDLKLFSLHISLPVSPALKYKFQEGKKPLILFTVTCPPPHASNVRVGAQ